MAKPKKVRPEKLGLGKAVKRALAEKGGTPLEHHFVHTEASSSILEKLRLPKEKLERAKQMAAHNQRLLEANARVSRGMTMTVKTARIIIERVLEEMPGLIKRHREFDRGQLNTLETLKTNLEKDLKKLKSVSDELPTSLAMQFLRNAIDIHNDEMRHLMGKKKFGLYSDAMRRTFRVMSKKDQQKGLN